MIAEELLADCLDRRHDVLARVMFTFWLWKIETWALIVAFVALVHPGIRAILRRFFRAGSVDIYETVQIEIGFSLFAATIGLFGTLRARDRDFFIQSAFLTLIRPGEEP